MKFIKKKAICAFLITCCVLGGAGAISGIHEERALAYTVELTASEIATSYYINDTLTLPTSVTAEYEGKTYTLTDSVLYYPDGTAYQQTAYELNQTGTYKVVYTLRVDGDILQAVKVFSVVDRNWQVEKDKSSVEYGELSIKQEGHTHGLKVSLIDGDTFTYNVPVDLSKNDVSDFITIHSTQTTATAKVQNIIVRATDCYDASNYVDFYLYYAPGGSIYARAGASCNDDTGLYKSDTLEATSIRKIVYIDGVRYAAYFSNWGVSMATGANATSASGFTWRYNNETKEVRVFQSRSPEGGDKVTELANADIYGDDLFEGFTTGEVYLSVFAEGYSDLTADFEISCIDGKMGEDLILADYADTQAPVLEIDYTPTIGNAVYVAQGEEVEIFDHTAIDVSGIQVETAVYYNYESTKRSNVYLKDGVFTATQPGAYTIVYTATDFYGNKTQKKVVVNSVTTDNGKAIDFSVEELTEISAGVETVLPVYEAIGLNGDVTVETRVTAPNGSTELIKGESFIPLCVGTYTFEYRYYDAIREYTYSYEVESKASDMERFLSDLSIPRYFIKGARYGLEDIKAYVFTSQDPTPVNATFYVKYDGGEYVVADVNDFTVSGSESVQVKYEYDEAVLESEVAEIVDVGYEKRISISKYFQGDFTAEEKGAYVNYCSAATSGNNALHFINTLSLSNFKLEFTVPLGAYYKSLRLTLTDYYDHNVKSVIELTTIDGGLGVYIDGVLYRCNDTFANGKLKSIWYNNDTHKFVLSDASTVSYSNKFTSDWCLLDVEVVDIIGESSIQIHSVNNQSFGKLTGDRIDPEIYAKRASGQRGLNDEIFLSPATYTDVLSPALQSTLKVLVKAPDGQYVKSNEGILLDGSASGCVSYTFTATQYGNYRVVYSAEDQKGNQVELVSVIIVEDEIAPEVTLSCKKQVKVSYLTVYKIDDFSISDNITAKDELVVTIVVIDEKNNSVISIGEEFEAKYKGEYSVYVYCVDNAGNSNYAKYTIIVDDVA